MADHTFIRAQFFMQLVLAHIHGIDPGCATLQQAIRKAAGGCAGIQANLVFHIKIEAIEKGNQLVGAPADITLAGQKNEAGIGRAGLPGLLDKLWPVACKCNAAGHYQTFRFFPALSQTLRKGGFVSSGS